MKRVPVLIMFLVLLVGLPPAGVQADSKMETFVAIGFQLPIDLFMTEAQVINKLGQPLKKSTHYSVSEHDSSVSVRYNTLYYTDLNILIVRDLDNNKEFVDGISFTGKSRRADYGLKVDVTKEQVVKVLGKPTVTDKKPGGQEFYFYSSNEDAFGVTFHFKNGKVNQIDWYLTL